MSTGDGRPVARSSVQIPKFRSKAMVPVPGANVGHRTLPSEKSVTRRASPPSAGIVQMFSEPLTSDTQ